MGANKFKDIEELCAIAEPTHGIITNIGMAHLEGFVNFEGVLRTKLELYDALVRSNGILFYNADDAVLTENLPTGIQSINYGCDTPATIVGELVALSPFVEMKWKSATFQSEKIETKMIGKYNFYNFLAAIAIGTHFGVENDAISEAIRTYTPTNNRSQIEKTAKNTLILDAYNANPTSMKSALESFAKVTENRKYVILGDMFELGAESVKEHQKIINLLLELQLNAICVGENFFQLKSEAEPTIQFFPSKEKVATYLKSRELKDHLILLKGSRGIGLETIVPYL
jgi:UDP-N-acetylmuramoyl-tripeptide--D-alanyl-D-alanine ligase